MVNKREILINDRLYEITDLKTYLDNKDAFLQGYTAIDIGRDYILPVVSSTSTDPGICLRSNVPFAYAREPIGEKAEQYRREHVIDYSKAETFKEFIETQDLINDIEKTILTSPDNIFTPVVGEEDSPAMRGLKEAVIDKQIDLDKYEPRFGANYPNDRRTFTKSDISIKMLTRMCNALDIKATLTLENQDTDDPEGIPNPMDKKITVELTSRQSENEEEEE